MTNLESLPLPAAFREVAATTNRPATVDAQTIEVDLDWWHAALNRRRLPGRVVTDIGKISGSDIDTASGAGASGDDDWDANPDAAGGGVGHRGLISRRTLFALGDPAAGEPVHALTLLWTSLAWGAGTSARNMNRRLDAVAANPAAAGALRDAAALSRRDVRAAYELLRPGRSNLLPFLGPAFFTKYLYFAGGSNPSHPWLILDARVANTLRRHGWESLSPDGAWPPHTYLRYCFLPARWAREASTPQRPVAADELEVWLFRED